MQQALKHISWQCIQETQCPRDNQIQLGDVVVELVFMFSVLVYIISIERPFKSTSYQYIGM